MHRTMGITWISRHSAHIFCRAQFTGRGITVLLSPFISLDKLRWRALPWYPGPMLKIIVVPEVSAVKAVTYRI